MDKELTKYLASFLTEKRLEILKNVLSNRTKYVTVVLEDIFQPHNASAVLRTCDCFGVQDVHIIENKNKYSVNPKVAMGSAKWLNLNKYTKNENNTLETIHKLKSQGYRIVATSPHTNDVNINDFDLTKGKSAFIFGTELTGISDIVKENADEFVKIPMYGFTESFNISVCAALLLNTITDKLRNSTINWKLSENDYESILFEWIKKSIKHPESIIKSYKNQKNKD